MMQPGMASVDSLRGVYVLIVDSDRERGVLLTRVLEYCGAYVQIVDSAKAALRTMQHMRPDVVFSDVDAIGCDLVRDLRALKPEAGGVVPVIGVGEPGRESGSRSGGCDVFLAVPFVPWQVCGLVQQLTAE